MRVNPPTPATDLSYDGTTENAAGRLHDLYVDILLSEPYGSDYRIAAVNINEKDVYACKQKFARLV